MSTYKQFLLDLADGQVWERVAQKIICKLNEVEVIKTCDNYRYDFMTSDNITYEVKHGGMDLKTGNTYIEYECFSKPSGIEITEADYWMIITEKDYILIKTEELKAMDKLCSNIRGGREKKSYGHLIKRSTFDNIVPYERETICV